MKYADSAQKIGNSLYTIAKTVTDIGKSLSPISLLTACFLNIYNIYNLAKSQNQLAEQVKKCTCQCGQCQGLIANITRMIRDKTKALVFQTIFPPISNAYKIYDAGKTLVDTVKQDKGKEFTMATQLWKNANESSCPVAVLIIIFLLEENKKADQVLFIRSVAAISAADGYDCLTSAIKSKTGG